MARLIDTFYGRLAIPDDPADVIGAALIAHGEWAFLESWFVARVLPDSARVADIGAFVGTFGLGLAKLRPLAKITFVEANPAIVPLLSENVKRNFSGPCSIVKALLAGTRQPNRLGYRQPGNLGSLTFQAEPSQAHTIEVVAPDRILDLAELIDQEGEFDLIKLDVEGMEEEIVRGGADLLKASNALLWLECNEHVRSLGLAAALIDMGYEVTYFAWPAFNPDNYRGSAETIFPFAYEAGLLASRSVVPELDRLLLAHDCHLERITGPQDLRKALWRTPRGADPEWWNEPKSALVSLAWHAVRGESFDGFLQQREDANAREAGQLDGRRSVAGTGPAERPATRRDAELAILSKRPEQIAAAGQGDAAPVPHSRRATRLMDRFARMRFRPGIRLSPRWPESADEKQTGEPPPQHTDVAEATVASQPTAPAVAADRPEPAAPIAKTDDQEVARPFFDATYYLSVYEDVLRAGVDPLQHFMEFGWREHRNPSATFNTRLYLSAHPELVASHVNPLVHFARSGQRAPLVDWERARLDEVAAPTVSVQALERLAPATPLAELLRAAAAEGPAAGLAVAVSHEDYLKSTGGVQIVVADDERAFTDANWLYLHVSPGQAIPMLAEGSADSFFVQASLNGRELGIYPFGEVVEAAASVRLQTTTLLIHHLMGLVPELLVELARSMSPTVTIAWVHDFFHACQSHLLLRNDIRFCDAPDVNSGGCRICIHGENRPDHLARMRALFEALRPLVLAPSESALARWRRFGFACSDAKVRPHAILDLDEARSPAGPRPASLRVAFLGLPVFPKGWLTYAELVRRSAGDSRYEFTHFGMSPDASLELTHVPVRVTSEDRRAMIGALVANRIDVVVVPMLTSETFSFTTHEALAAGAFVVARLDSGNVWPTIRALAPEQGLPFASDEELFSCFADGRLFDLVGSRRRGHLRFASASFAEVSARTMSGAG